jgi:DNA polymerase-1
VGYALNPNSPKQISEHFYKKLGIKPYRNRKTGGVSTDEKALKRIGRRGYKDAYTILKIRGTAKETSTFLDPNKVDCDARMRCSFNPVGTRFSRISSSKNIFGTGNNLQNQPHKVLQHFIPDSNYIAYGLDLSQAENRIVAYEGRIDQMIEAFETGQDVHSLTAKIMINIFYGPEKGQFITPEDKAPLGDGNKTWRDWGKRANHGLNYDLGYKAFALGNEITERDGKLIVNTYHLGYPGVRQGYHTYVQRCINTSRTLTNLMGRKTLFLDRLDDKLYKAAYACIPQGTVGDVIDQRAMGFVYYNKARHFRWVELLMQIHDQIVFQIPTPLHPTRPVSWANHAKVLLDTRRSMETPLHTHYGRKFVIPSDLTMGITLNKDSGVEMKGEGFPRTVPELAQKLEKSYQELTKIWLPMVA